MACPLSAVFGQFGDGQSPAKTPIKGMAATGTNLPTALSPLAKALGNLSAVAVTTSGSLTHLAAQPFNQLHRAIGAIQSQIVSFVQFANPAAVIRFRLAWEDLSGVLGRILAPVLNNLTFIVQRLADYLHSASGPAKGLVAVMVTVGVVVAAVTGGFVGMTGVLIVLKLVLDVFTGGISAIVGLIGAAIGALAAGGIGAVGMGLAVTPFDQLKSIIEQIGPPLLKIFEMIGSAVMSFAGGALPGLMNAVQAIVAAINTVVRSLPGAGNVFEVIGQHVGAFIQFLATGFQLVATAASVLIDVFRSLGQLIFGNVDLLGALSRGFERMMAVLKAVSIVLSGDEDQGGENKPPPKAPPAVRQATSQNVQSFLTKSYISAFQTGGDKDTQFKSTVSEKIIEIEKHAMSIKNDIKAFLNRVRDNANAAADAAPAAAGIAGSVAGGPVGGVVAWAATRAILSRVTGK